MWWLKFDDCVLKLGINNIDMITAEQGDRGEWSLNFLFTSGKAFTGGYYNNKEDAIMDRDTILGLLECHKIYTLEEIRNLTLNSGIDNLPSTEACTGPSATALAKLTEPIIKARKFLSEYLDKEAEKYSPIFDQEEGE